MVNRRLGDAREPGGPMGPSTIQEEQSDDDGDSEEGDDEDDAHNIAAAEQSGVRSNGTTINTIHHHSHAASSTGGGSAITILSVAHPTMTTTSLPPPSVSPNGGSTASLNTPPVNDPAAAIAKKNGLRIQTSPKPTPSTKHRAIVPFDPIDAMMEGAGDKDKDQVSPVNSGDEASDYKAALYIKPKAKEKKKDKVHSHLFFTYNYSLLNNVLCITMMNRRKRSRVYQVLISDAQRRKLIATKKRK
jgi:hypothetical protein